jgi:hypothetical protein
MSLVAALRANNLSQLNTVTEIKYSNRNSTARDHAMIAARSGTPVHAPALSSGTVQGPARSARRVLQLDPLPQACFEASSPTRRDTRSLTPVLRRANTPRVPLACH